MPLHAPPVDQAPHGKHQEDEIEHHRQPQSLHRVEADRQHIDPNPQDPAFDQPPRLQELRGNANNSCRCVPPRQRGIGVALNEARPDHDRDRGPRGPSEPGTHAELLDDDLPVARGHPRPRPPAIKIDREEEELEQRVAVELRVVENAGVKRDHRQRERVVPDAPPHDERDVDHAEHERDDFERRHG